MLETASWLPLAQAVPLGQRRRVNHTCGGGRTLLVSNSADGFRGTCFRCSEPTAFAPPPELSLAERLERIRQQQSGDSGLRSAPATALPDGLLFDPSDWPVAGYLWFLKAGLSRADIGELGAGFDPVSQRVILPVRDRAGAVVFWQARAIDGRQPKYLAPDVERRLVLPVFGHPSVARALDGTDTQVPTGNEQVAVYGQAPHGVRTNGAITLTEDILSAYKVGLTDNEAWSMLGTKLTDHILTELIKRQPSRVNVWLDNDLPPTHQINRGQVAAKKVLSRLRAVGLKAHNIVSNLDPKLLPRSDIKEYLNVEIHQG